MIQNLLQRCMNALRAAVMGITYHERCGKKIGQGCQEVEMLVLSAEFTEQQTLPLITTFKTI